MLQGDKKGISSVRINIKYRLEFTVREVLGEQVITVCRLLDISNHYIYAPNELVCAVAIHPGEMLRDELQARGMSQRKFAGIIGMPYTAFNEIINGKRPITTDTALKIEAATGIAATIWLGLQTDYNMQTARRDNKLTAILENIRKSVAVL